MAQSRVALITGANQGMGKQVARELVADGKRVYMGSRDPSRGEAAAAEIGLGAIAVRIDVSDRASIERAADRIGSEAGRLDVLVNNAATSTTHTGVDLADLRAASAPSVVSLDEVRAVWEVNVFGALAVYQAMLPLLRESPDARIVNVTSALGSLTTVSTEGSPYRRAFEVVYSASKTALNAVTLAMMTELDGSAVKVNLVSPGFANTALVNFQGTDTVEDAAREIVRVARLGPRQLRGPSRRGRTSTSRGEAGRLGGGRLGRLRRPRLVPGPDGDPRRSPRLQWWGRGSARGTAAPSRRGLGPIAPRRLSHLRTSLPTCQPAQ